MRSSLTAPGPTGAAAFLLAIAGARAAPPPDVHALENAAYYFRAQDGTVLTLLAVRLLPDRGPAASAPGNGDPDYVGAAQVEEVDRHGEDIPGAEHRALALDLAPGVETNDGPTFYGRVYLRSGRKYSIRYVVEDAALKEIFLKNALLNVPYLTGGLSASSVVPAERFGPAAPDAGPFQVGSDEVVPKAGGVFRRSEMLRLYLQVYDARTDPETANRRVDLVYRFSRVINGSSKHYGKPYTVRGAAGPSMGLTLRIADWPAGRYRVVVEIHDRIAAARTATESAFSIVGD